MFDKYPNTDFSQINLDWLMAKIHELEENQKQASPTKLPNPFPLEFTGSASGSYDGSSPVTVNIPQGGGGGAVNSVNGKTGDVNLMASDIMYAGQLSMAQALQAQNNLLNGHSAAISELNENKINEPAQDGTAGQVLTTDGAGGRSWTTPQGGGDKPWTVARPISELGEDVATIEFTFPNGATEIDILFVNSRLNNADNTASNATGYVGVELSYKDGTVIDGNKPTDYAHLARPAFLVRQTGGFYRRLHFKITGSVLVKEAFEPSDNVLTTNATPRIFISPFVDGEFSKIKLSANVVTANLLFKSNCEFGVRYR